MSGDDGKKDQDPELEIHPAPDVIEFANTFVSFREAISKALTEGGHDPLGSEHEIDLFRIWYVDKTDREILNATSDIDNNKNDNKEWFADDGEELA